MAWAEGVCGTSTATAKDFKLVRPGEDWSKSLQIRVMPTAKSSHDIEAGLEQTSLAHLDPKVRTFVEAELKEHKARLHPDDIITSWNIIPSTVK